jgi:hypothetical protein
MKSGPLTLTLAATLAASAIAPVAATAQSYDPYGSYNREVDNYQARRSTYEQQRADYEAARARYEADRRAYDARWGYGAYERRYGPFRGYYVGDVTTDRGYYSDRNYYNNRYYSAYRDTPCERQRSNNSTAGTIIGALAGAAIGSNVAARNARTEGAILGAVVGGALGNNIGKSTARCDSRGYYYTYDQTYPYRESSYYNGRRSGAYDSNYYRRSRCRLAVAPVDYGNSTDYRYVRVCPDGNGRYRITR